MINRINYLFLLIIDLFGVVVYLKDIGREKILLFLIYLYLFSRTEIRLNISSSLTTGSSRAATLIAFDGLLTDNSQIQLENIEISHQSCPSSKIYLII